MNEVKIDERIQTFLQRLAALPPGERAQLKRSAGRRLAEAGAALGLFYRLLPYGVPAVQEEMYFLAATLFPLAEGGGRGDLGAALRQAQLTAGRGGLDRRVEILIDADPAQLPFRLRQAVHYLQSNRVKVDWTQLLADLLLWTHPNRYVQSRWAKSYFSITTPQK